MKKPSRLKRAQMALRFYRNGPRAFIRTNPLGETKKAPFLWPTWRHGEPVWQITDYLNYAEEGFNLNSVIYSAIMYKVRAITAAPLQAYGGTREEPELLDAGHPLAQLVARPNPYQSWAEFQGLCEVYLNLSGNSYVMVDRKRNEMIPDALYPLRPDRMYIAAQKGSGDVTKMLGYIYVPEGKTKNNGVPMLPENVMHVKLPNPLDPLEGMGYGLSPISAMARSADVDNEITRYLKLFFEKGAMPIGALSSDQPLSDDVIGRAQDQWEEAYGGVDNWIRLVVLERGMAYQRLGLTFDEMGFEGLDERNEARIAGPFGVPPILIGARVGLKHATYSNYGMAKSAFWQDTMKPELVGFFETEYSYYLQGDSGEFVAFDLSGIAELQVLETERAAMLGEAFTRGAVTRNEYRAAAGLDPDPAGDVYLVSFNLMEIPAGRAAPPRTEAGQPEAQEEAAEGKAIGREVIQHVDGISEGEYRVWYEDVTSEQRKLSPYTHEQKVAFWKVMDAQARQWERRFADAAEAAFEHDRREILALVGEAKAAAVKAKKTVGWSETLLSVTDYLRVGGSENWRENFAPVLAGLVQERAEQLNVEFGIQFDVTNLLAADWFDNYVNDFWGPILDTSEAELRALFQQAINEGWSVPDMTKRLELMFQQWMKGDVSPDEFAWYEERMPHHRREVIARTETIGASNKGSFELYKGWGAEGKEWLTTLDGRQRPSHEATTGQVKRIDEPFDVGGFAMMHPGDKNAPAGEIANCRCTVLPVLKMPEG